MYTALAERKIILKVSCFPYIEEAVDMIMCEHTMADCIWIHKTFERQKPRGFCFNLHPAYKIKSGKRRQPLVEKRPFMLLKIALGNDPWPAHMLAYDINQKRRRRRRRKTTRYTLTRIHKR